MPQRMRSAYYRRGCGVLITAEDTEYFFLYRIGCGGNVEFFILSAKNVEGTRRISNLSVENEEGIQGFINRRGYGQNAEFFNFFRRGHRWTAGF
jgi:hypothetical protein